MKIEIRQKTITTNRKEATMRIILESPEGKTVIAWNISLEDSCKQLQKARKVFFGRKGKISYTKMQVTCDECIMFMDNSDIDNF